EHLLEPPAARLDREVGDLAQLVDAPLGVHPSEARDFEQRLRARLREVLGREADLLLERAVRMRPRLVVDEVGDVLPQDPVERMLRQRLRGLAEELLEGVERTRKSAR